MLLCNKEQLSLLDAIHKLDGQRMRALALAPEMGILLRVNKERWDKFDDAEVFVKNKPVSKLGRGEEEWALENSLRTWTSQLDSAVRNYRAFVLESLNEGELGKLALPNTPRLLD